MKTILIDVLLLMAIVCVAVLTLSVRQFFLTLDEDAKQAKAVIIQAEKTTKRMEDTLTQARLTVMSLHGLSFDLRKNWTANQQVQEKTLATLVKITNATERAIITITDEFALTMDRTRNTIIPATEDTLKELRSTVAETKLAIHDLSIETAKTIAEVRPVLQATEKTITGIGTETQTVLRKVQPIEDNLGDLSKNVANMSLRLDNVIAKYEKTILHPSWKQRVKGVFQLILSSFNLWADMRLIF